MYSLQSRINKIDKLLHGQTSRAINPEKEDLELVRNHYFLDLRGTKNEVSDESLKGIWLSVSKDLKFNYRATIDRFKEMKSLTDYTDKT